MVVEKVLEVVSFRPSDAMTYQLTRYCPAAKPLTPTEHESADSVIVNVFVPARYRDAEEELEHVTLHVESVDVPVDASDGLGVFTAGFVLSG